MLTGTVLVWVFTLRALAAMPGNEATGSNVLTIAVWLGVATLLSLAGAAVVARLINQHCGNCRLQPAAYAKATWIRAWMKTP